MSSSNTNGRDQANYQLGIPKVNADQLDKSGKTSAERRGKDFWPESIKLPTDKQASQLDKSGKGSASKRKQ